MLNDRFEQQAKRELATPWVLNQPRLAMLLRRQHAAYVRLVSKMPCIYADASGVCGRPAPRICKLSRGQLLDAFARFKKGTR